VNPLRPGAWRTLLTLTFVGTLLVGTGFAQDESIEDRLKILTDPQGVKAKVKAKAEEEKLRSRFELNRTQVAPLDVIPFVKANHWSTLFLELRANYENFDGTINTSSFQLIEMSDKSGTFRWAPREVDYQRVLRLQQDQPARLSLQAMIPAVPSAIRLDLKGPDSVRPVESWSATLRTLEPHQMLILVLSDGANDVYARWSRFNATIPLSVDPTEDQVVGRRRYYHLVLPQERNSLPLSSHPLTWSTLSHVIWDGFPADRLSVGQQEAMLDWLHWGGQLILMGGAKASFATLRDSFLDPYLPASLSGENTLLKAADLESLSKDFPPVIPYNTRETEPVDYGRRIPLGRYAPAVMIRPAENQPLYLTGLAPKPESYVLRLGESSERIMGVEQRVGRGRILMLGFSLTDPAIQSWPGLDTFVRRVVLRRPEEPTWVTNASMSGLEANSNAYLALSGQDLSWYRILARDLNATAVQRSTSASRADADPSFEVFTSPRMEAHAQAIDQIPVAEWLDSSQVPRECRDVLEMTNGISIPDSRYVLKVLLLYLVALVPLNWLICRYVLGRKEWAWIVVPTLSFVAAIGIERFDAYDMGFALACDEINILETQPGYPKAHLSRFASIYSSDRNRFQISFPNDPTALALPMGSGRSLRGEDIRSSTWVSHPVPSLNDLTIEPRSLSYFRAEQLLNLPGTVSLMEGAEGQLVRNELGFDLENAMVVKLGEQTPKPEWYLGTVKNGSSVVLAEGKQPTDPEIANGELNPASLLALFQESLENRPENQGELRLVAWAPRVMPGESFEPKIDRHRGFTVVVAHLQMGPPPPPYGPRFDAASKSQAH